MKTLITGFNSYAEIKVNPSQIIVEEIREIMKNDLNINVTAIVLPTEYENSGNQIQQQIRQIKPDIVLCLGVATDQDLLLRLERVALNLDDAIEPDNAGIVRSGQPIVIDALPAYFSTLPLEEIRDNLNAQDIPVVISNHAGTYVCNHVYYMALHEIKKLQLNTLCGFMHVPLVIESFNRFSPRLNLLDIIQAVEYILSILRNKIVDVKTK